MTTGIYFTKIAALGVGKSVAEIDFQIGFNVITGASNTGKSYVIDCIDFILGSKNPPKDIAEAKGYDRIRAEINTTDGKIFTLNREFGKKYISVAKCRFDEYEKYYPKNYSTRHSEKNENNISWFLLSLINLSGKKLKKNRYNETKSLSFRDIAKFSLVSETKIIETDSPIYSGQNTEITANKSLFRLLLTGIDDEELIQIEDPKLRKSKINGMIELIKNEIESKRLFLVDAKEELDGLSDDEINFQINRLVKTVEEAHSELLNEEKKRAETWKILDDLMSQKSQNEEILKRFELLNQHYLSDLDRLEFIYEGTQGIEQLKEVNCPLCNSLIDQNILEPYIREEDILDSIKYEYIKIDTKKEQLLMTTNQINDTIDKLNFDIDSVKQEYDKIDKYISDKLKPIHQTHSVKLNQFLQFKELKSQINLVEKQIVDLRKSLAYYNERLREKEKTAPEIQLPEKIYSDLSNEIKEIFISWGLDCRTVRYDPEINDIIINGEKRSNSGKGYRAIYLAGFMVGVLLFCLKRNLKHPRFLILDSPLTQYKERDTNISEIDSNDFISEDIVVRFYESLVSLPEINKIQIIVIENRDPPINLRSKMNYIHFSKNKSIGRYGFYPV